MSSTDAARRSSPVPPRRGVALRVVPVELSGVRRPQRMLERQWLVNRSGGWSVLITGFFEPLFYLLSIRIGFGALIGDVEVDGRSIPYAEFVAPALLAASAMNGALYESTMNVYFKMKHAKIYDAVLATPLSAGDVAVGEILNATIRGGLYSVAFLATMWALGMTDSSWALGMLPIAVLISFAFSALGLSGATFMRSWADFEYVPSVMLPMFLFSATFYPVSSYGGLAWIANLSPLYHGVVVCRGLNLGELSWSMLGHLAVLVALALVAVVVSTRRIRHLLLT